MPAPRPAPISAATCTGIHSRPAGIVPVMVLTSRSTARLLMRPRSARCLKLRSGKTAAMLKRDRIFGVMPDGERQLGEDADQVLSGKPEPWARQDAYEGDGGAIRARRRQAYPYDDRFRILVGRRSHRVLRTGPSQSSDRA